MLNTFTPLNISKNFPSQKVLFFGHAKREREEYNEPGFVAVDVEYPNQLDILEFTLEDIPFWENYVPTNVPELTNMRFTFRERKEIAENKLVQRRTTKNRNLDAFYIGKDEIAIIKLNEDGNSAVHNSNIMLQAINFYSDLIRKNAVAIRDADYRAAELTEKSKNSSSLEQSLETETQLTKTFNSLIKHLLTYNTGSEK